MRDMGSMQSRFTLKKVPICAEPAFSLILASLRGTCAPDCGGQYAPLKPFEFIPAQILVVDFGNLPARAIPGVPWSCVLSLLIAALNIIERKDKG